MILWEENQAKKTWNRSQTYTHMSFGEEILPNKIAQVMAFLSMKQCILKKKK